MQQIKYNKENPNGVLVDLTAEELANNETAKKEAEQKNLAEQ